VSTAGGGIKGGGTSIYRPKIGQHNGYKIGFNIGEFCLPQFPSHPVSTAGGGIKGGGTSIYLPKIGQHDGYKIGLNL